MMRKSKKQINVLKKYTVREVRILNFYISLLKKRKGKRI